MSVPSVLTFNTGSSSIKFSVFALSKGGHAGTCRLRGAVRDLGGDADLDLSDPADQSGLASMIRGVRDTESLVRAISLWICERYGQADILGCGHRIVHGGADHSGPVPASGEIVSLLSAYVPFAPAHQPQNLAGLRAARSVFPTSLHTLSFDTAFHRSVPRIAQIYALPRSLTQEGILRYGFHGLAFASVVRKVFPAMTAPSARILALHLGSGTSGCAIVDGRSVATSMGLTALDGLPMATRCGDLDPGVVLYLRGEKGMSHEAVTELLYHQSGLRGVSGLSGNMRVLLESDEPDAREAIDLYCYRTAREAGSLVSSMGGVDAVVFSGGVGENAPEVRRQIIERLGWMGLEIDAAANRSNADLLSAPDAAKRIIRVSVDEEAIIADECASLLSG